MTAPVTYVLGVLREVLDLLTDTVAGCPIAPLPCRTILSPGFEVAWDSCGDGCSDGREGQLWAALQTMTATPSTNGCRRIVWQAEIGVVRCEAGMGADGSPPPELSVEHDALQQAADADSIAQAITCCAERSEAIDNLELVSWQALGPSGGCVGGAWIVQGVLDTCCDTPPAYTRGTNC